MEKIRFFVIILVFGFSTLNAQAFLTSSEKPKYLPENKASSYLGFTVEQKADEAWISIGSLENENVKNHTFYILKGLSNEKSDISWQIIAVFKNTEKKSFHKSYIDKNDNKTVVWYRIMVKNDEEKIEYSPIISLKNASSQSTVTGS